MACNLTIDPTGASDFTGATGKAVNLSIKGSSGIASMTAARYAGANISVNPATLTIQTGDNTLSLMIDNTVPGDVTVLVCDDGTVLNRFRFDANNPARFYDVRGV
jgi:hypothetical protein